jgi:alpha-ketoglutarate-dependent dioxygenase alkB family protein 2
MIEKIHEVHLQQQKNIIRQQQMKRTLKELSSSKNEDKSKNEQQTKKQKTESTKVAKPQKGITWIKNEGAHVEYFPRFLTKKQSKDLFDAIMKQADWQRDIFNFMGKVSQSPRLVSAFADDDGIAYYYTGQTRVAQKWIPELIELRDRIQQHTGEDFNYVLINRYDDGNSYIGWHSDKRTNLKKGSSIVSVTLGQQRPFQFKHKKSGDTVVTKDLEDGSLLVMNDATQDLYKHSLPKRANIIGQRLNLTFRSVVSKKK